MHVRLRTNNDTWQLTSQVRQLVGNFTFVTRKSSRCCHSWNWTRSTRSSWNGTLTVNKLILNLSRLSTLNYCSFALCLFNITSTSVHMWSLTCITTHAHTTSAADYMNCLHSGLIRPLRLTYSSYHFQLNNHFPGEPGSASSSSAFFLHLFHSRICEGYVACVVLLVKCPSWHPTNNVAGWT